MFETHMTIVGNVLNEPEFKRVKNDQTVCNFRVISTSRRFNRMTDAWEDGPILRVRVSCWRQLADSVGRSVHKGDPVIVTGRLHTRDWIAGDNSHRVSYELEANTIGHDLSRGFDKFTRHKTSLSTTAVEDAEAEQRVAGEPAESVPELNNRVLSHDYDEELGGFVTSVERDAYDPFGDDDEYTDDAAQVTSPTEDEDTDPEPDSDEAEPTEPARKRRKRQPVGV